MPDPQRVVALPAPALRPFVSHYAGTNMWVPAPLQHAGPRHIDVIISLGEPIEIVRMPGPQPPGAPRSAPPV